MPNTQNSNGKPNQKKSGNSKPETQHKQVPQTQPRRTDNVQGNVHDSRTGHQSLDQSKPFMKKLRSRPLISRW
jgi:hypothetical protein